MHPDKKKGSYDDYEASLIRLALTELRHDMDTADIPISDEEILKRRDASYAKAMQHIDAEIARRNRRRFTRHTLPRIGVAAACVVLVCLLGITTAIATVSSVRVRVLEFLVNMTPEYAELSLRENDGLAFDVPVEWEGKYFPSYLPEGSSRYTADCVDDCYDIFYDLGDGTHFEFSEYGPATATNLDTENADVSTVSVGGVSAMMVKKRGVTSVVWANEERYFLVSGNLDEDVLLEISRSVKLIR